MSKRYIVTFLAVAFGFSYTAWIVAMLLPSGRSTELFSALSFLAMLGPLLGTVTVKRLGWRKEGLRDPIPRSQRLRSGLVGILLLMVILWAVQFFLWILLSTWVTGNEFRVTWAVLGQMLFRSVLLPLFWILSVFLEEYGWRYFLFSEAKKMGPWAASWGVGFVWAIWHAPAAFLLGRSNAWAMILGYLIYVPVLHQYIAYFYEKSTTLIVPVILHAVFNGFGTAQYLTTRIQGSLGEMTQEQILALSRPDLMTRGEVLVTLGVNLATFVLLLPFSVLLQREISRAMEARRDKGAASVRA